MRATLAITVATLTAAATVFVGLLHIPAGDELRPPASPPLHVRACHPVDASDLSEDRVEGEQETLDDEGELACVGGKRFALIRRRLGLKGQAPAAT